MNGARRRLVLWGIALSACGTPGCQSGANDEEALRGLVTAAPWITDYLEMCRSYRAAKADADKIDLFHASLRLTRSSSINGATGEVEQIFVGSPEAPDEIALQIKVGDDFRLASQAQKKPIKNGTPIFEKARTLKKGDCVVVTARALEPTAQDRAGQLCTPRFYAEFSDLVPCPR